MAKRSNLIVILGVAVFIVGAGATFLIARGGGSDEPTSSGPGRVTVLYAAEPIPSGTSGSTALNEGLIKSKAITESAKPANALTDSTQVAGRTAALGVAQGQVITQDHFKENQTRIGTLKIPDGKTALALSMENVPGVAGFVGAGDFINVYGVAKNDPAINGGSGITKLVMQNVEVLNVNGAALAASQGQPGGTGLVYLLAVSPTEAEQLIYLNTFQDLYFSLVSKDHAPTGPTPGVASKDALKTL
ncbi:MAG: Flp pilus assembly protein CpaB [Acidimicrobiales bacterium]